MKKFLALILSLICVFAVAFTGCFDLDELFSGGTGNEQQGDGNHQEQEPGGDETGAPDDSENNGDNGDNKEPESPKNPDDGKDDENNNNPQNPDDGKDDENNNNPQNPDGGKDDENNNNPQSPDDGKDDENNNNPQSPDDGKDDDKGNTGGNTGGGNNNQNVPVGNDFGSWKSKYYVGDKFPDFTVETYNSSYKEGTFSSASARGKVLVINFWYVSCGVCIDEMWSIEELNEKYGDDIVVLAVHKDNAEQAYAQTYIDMPDSNHNKVAWTNYKTIFGKDFTGDKLFNSFNIPGRDYPASIVLDPDGVIINITYGSVLEFDMETHVYTNTLIPYIDAALKNRKN